MYKAAEEKEFYKDSKHFLSNPPMASSYDRLIEILTYHEWRYAVQNDPVIADYEYDQLFDALKSIEKDNPLLIRQDSPSQRIASDLNPDFPTVKHLSPMLSLGNSYNADDLLDFDKQIKKLTSTDADVIYNVEPKYDGGSIAAVYENDMLVKSATRGNGVEGEDITPNARSLKSIPLKASFSKYGIVRAELRGEAIIPLDLFKKINKERESKGQKLFANPRNAATGGLRMKDANETGARGIEVFMFQLSFAEDANGNNVLTKFKNHSEHLEMLGNLGFKIPKEGHLVAKNINEVVTFVSDFEAKRDDLDYEIDGMVVKVNDLEVQEKVGFTQHHPRWAIAYKFKAKQATTTLVDVEYQIGKVGSITPVAKVEPVFVAGVTISSISLHNEDFIVQKDLRIGDKVLVERAGDVIPYIVKSLADLRTGEEKKIVFPKYCPRDHEEKVELIQYEGEAAWRCPNCQFGRDNLQKIIFHVSKSAMDIDGFGKSNVERFYELGWVNDISDIYNLDYDAIEQLEGFGKKSADKIQASVEKAKSNPLQKVLASLSIHHLGKKASKLIAQQVNHVYDLKVWSEEDFTSIKDIGPVVAENVKAWLAFPGNLEMLQRLEEYGVNLSQTEEDKPKAVVENAPLSGKTILFTGSLQNLKRKEAQEIAETNGATNISGVSKKLDILVVGEKAGSKLTKAQALGTVKILTEEEFIQLLELDV